MKKKLIIIVAAIALTVMCYGPVCAKIEWRVMDGIQLDDTPVGIAISIDGATIYVLCRGSIKVYSMPKKELVESIPLQEEYSQITIGPNEETLLLTDAGNKKISIVEVTPVFDIKIGHSQVIGKADAKVSIFIFSDYQCPYCTRIYPTLERLLEKYPDQVNLVNKHYPLQSHKFAMTAAIASIAAARQGKFPEVSRTLYKEYSRLSDEKIREIVVNAGLDMERFDDDIKDPLIISQINSDVQMAEMMKIRGVPSIYIGGRFIKDHSLKGMSEAIEKELNKK
ncbi:MAG: thioredoxin domain-containing protein [Proteobacteria bacterium]|nr:thioredoxin domain-containing protein [Pseudomonadota bacterium]MBU1388832.1 thioredoxin domain-containing protein [Pseudomonadota bacterium]MBU1542213.1 thioredoxin domain-containing protein [Pseudomonadota bacterium]MBU2480403.1 thioredoxin domain-containing protein [Pseudomonadota bacterium]